MMQCGDVKEIINNPSYYRRTLKKKYEAYVCRPILGRACHDTMNDIIRTTSEEEPFVMSGIIGEFWTISFEKLASTYNLMCDGCVGSFPISEAVIKDISNKYGLMDWKKVRTKATAGTYWALNIPMMYENLSIETKSGCKYRINHQGPEHGSGDMVVCADKDGEPNLDDMWVVNGVVFPYTYRTDNFKDIFAGEYSVTDVPYPCKNFLRVDDN